MYIIFSAGENLHRLLEAIVFGSYSLNLTQAKIDFIYVIQYKRQQMLSYHLIVQHSPNAGWMLHLYPATYMSHNAE